jgi:hypothetical protein
MVADRAKLRVRGQFDDSLLRCVTLGGTLAQHIVTFSTHINVGNSPGYSSRRILRSMLLSGAADHFNIAYQLAVSRLA